MTEMLGYEEDEVATEELPNVVLCLKSSKSLNFETKHYSSTDKQCGNACTHT